MKNFSKYIIFSLILWQFIGLKIYAQTKITAEYVERTISIDKPLILRVIILNTEDRPTFKFPDIVHFKKVGNATKRNTNLVNGKLITDQIIEQEYIANNTGTFKLPIITIIVNEQSIKIPNENIIVTASESGSANEIENFKDFIDGSAKLLVNVKEDAFFAVTTNKTKPYVGEGFLITIALYVAQRNKAEMEFINENLQIEKILKIIEPKNCWKENFEINEIQKGSREIIIENKKYKQYKIFQATYFPFNNQPIYMPSVAWQMRKYKIAKDQEVSNAKVEDRKTFFSKSITIRPQALPSQKNKQDFAIGDFEIEEYISDTTIQTGQSFKYNFKVIGEGNLAMITMQIAKNDSIFDFYGKGEQINYSKTQGKVIGEKVFSYNIVPKLAGIFSLSNYFYLNIFNPKSKTFQLLKASKKIHIIGKKIVEVSEPILVEDDVYDNIENLASNKITYNYRLWVANIANVLVVLMLICLIYIYWPNKK